MKQFGICVPAARGCAVLLLVVLGIWPATSRAAITFESGARLLSECNSEAASAQVYCLGYTVGIADLMADGITIAGHRACFPEDTTKEKVRDIAVDWLGAHPDVSSEAADSLLAQAFSESFPCP